MAARTDRPNLLLIMSDQHRGDCLDFVTQASGERTAVQTPHLRRLAESGVHFPRFYSECPVCVPARALLSTGLLPHHIPPNGMYANGDILPADHPTLASILSQNGYFTQAIGKMHFRPVRERHGFDRLWLSEEIPWSIEEDEFLQFMIAAGYGHVEEPHGIRHELYELPQPSQLPETHHTSAWTGRQTVSFIREHVSQRRDDPFFCWTSFQKPHPPYEPPVPWHRLYRPEMAPGPIRSDEEFSWLPGSVRTRVAQGLFPDVHRLASMWAYYFGAISFIDSWIGQILDELERQGLRENTLVLYTADHGELMGDHWLFQKSHFYEQAACIPGVMSWPAGFSGGQARTQLAGLTDVVPTFLAAAGVDPKPYGLDPDGISLLDCARDDASTRDVHIGQVGRGPLAHFMAVSDEWKYTYMAGENRELLFRYRGEEPELHDYLQGGPDTPGGTTAQQARQTAASLRQTIQDRYRQDAAADALDDNSPNGFKLFPARAGQYRPRTPSGMRQQNMQYARWIQTRPKDWTPPPPSPEGQIPADLPLRSDRSAYTWPELPPVDPQIPPRALGAASELPQR